MFVFINFQGFSWKFEGFRVELETGTQNPMHSDPYPN